MKSPPLFTMLFVLMLALALPDPSIAQWTITEETVEHEDPDADTLCQDVAKDGEIMQDGELIEACLKILTTTSIPGGTRTTQTILVDGDLAKASFDQGYMIMNAKTGQLVLVVGGKYFSTTVDEFKALMRQMTGGGDARQSPFAGIRERMGGDSEPPEIIKMPVGTETVDGIRYSVVVVKVGDLGFSGPAAMFQDGLYGRYWLSKDDPWKAYKRFYDVFGDMSMNGERDAEERVTEALLPDGLSKRKIVLKRDAGMTPRMSWQEVLIVATAGGHPEGTFQEYLTLQRASSVQELFMAM